MMEHDQPNILFLRRCFLKECGSIEDMFDERLINQTIPYNTIYGNDDIKYDEIPYLFENTETWINRTNLKCWFCDSNFESIPLFIPCNVTKNGKNYTMNTLGNFCSFNCSAAYIDLHYNIIIH